MASTVIGLWLGCHATGVLKNALRAGVMDKLFSPDQSFGHKHFAPSAEAIRQLNSRYV